MCFIMELMNNQYMQYVSVKANIIIVLNQYCSEMHP